MSKGNITDTQHIVDLLKSGLQQNVDIALMLQKNTILDVRTLANGKLYKTHIEFVYKTVTGNVTVKKVIKNITTDGKFLVCLERSNNSFSKATYYLDNIIKVKKILPKKKTAQEIAKIFATNLFNRKKENEIRYLAKSFKSVAAMCYELFKLFGVKETVWCNKHGRSYYRLEAECDFFTVNCNCYKEVTVEFT